LGNLYLDLLSFLSLPIFSLEEEDDFFWRLAVNFKNLDFFF
jgi:hypothetical protein